MRRIAFRNGGTTSGLTIGAFVLYSIWVEYPQIIEMFPAYIVFNLLLSTLLILHVFWTYFLLKLIYLAVLKGSEVSE